MKLVRILAALGLSACATQDATSPAVSERAALDVQAASTGVVYTQTNDATANAVKVFTRGSDGKLTFVADFPTGGQGNGAPGLGSQGAIIIAEERFILAVNAGSNQISSFRITAGGLTLVETIPSGGVMPVSVTSWGPWVYVLNAGSDNITGFRINALGDLTALAGSTRSLSGSGVGAAQVEFSPSGRQIVVAEKNSNKIVVFSVAQGLLNSGTVFPSSGMTPFGFAFDTRGSLVVSEAFGGAPNASATSSYKLSPDGALVPVTKSLPTTETAACWAVITNNQSYVYVTNTGSNTITGYFLAPNGTLRRLTDDGISARTQAGPIDAGLSRSSPQFLYTLDRGAGAISIFQVNVNGSLTPVATQTGLPPTAYGLAVR